MKLGTVLKKAAISALLLIMIGSIGYTAIPKRIEKTYAAGIFSGKDLIKEVPVHLDGNLYRGIINIDYFVGTLEIEGNQTEVKTSRIGGATKSNFIKMRLRAFSDDYIYNASFIKYSKPINNQSEEVFEGISNVYFPKDFSEIYGYTVELRDQYGEKAYFKSPKELILIVN